MTLPVDCFSDQFFACAVFARDQYGRVGRAHPRDGLEQHGPDAERDHLLPLRRMLAQIAHALLDAAPVAYSLDLPSRRESKAPRNVALLVANTRGDLPEAEAFYCGILGCSKGRTSDRWTDLNFFGHQVVLHLVDDGLDVMRFGIIQARRGGLTAADVANTLEWDAMKNLFGKR